MANDPWETGSSSIGYYTSSSGTTVRSEVDMRQEFINTMSGSFPEIAKGQYGLLRRMRRTTTGKLIPCSCVDEITREPDKDIWCAICGGIGALWDEEYILFYKTIEGVDRTIGLSVDQIDPATLTGDIVVYYCRYDVILDEKDYIVEVSLDSAGDVVTPIVRTKISRISKVWEYRSDNGRVEYKKVYTYKDNTKYLNAPSYGAG